MQEKKVKIEEICEIKAPSKGPLRLTQNSHFDRKELNLMEEEVNEPRLRKKI